MSRSFTCAGDGAPISVILNHRYWYVKKAQFSIEASFLVCLNLPTQLHTSRAQGFPKNKLGGCHFSWSRGGLRELSGPEAGTCAGLDKYRGLPCFRVVVHDVAHLF